MMIVPGSAFLPKYESGGDPYSAYVVMLHHLDDATGLYDAQSREWGTTYAGIISGDRLTTRNYPTGLTDKIYLEDLTDFPCPGDCCLEMFIEFTDQPAAGAQISQSIATDANGNGNGPTLWLSCVGGTNTLYWKSGSHTTAMDTGVTLNEDTEYHIAVSREGEISRLFLQGTKIAEYDNNAAVGNAFASGTLLFGGTQIAGTNYFGIRINEIRLTNGHARYTDDFTVPPIPFPDP